MSSLIVRVTPGRGRGWVIALPDQLELISCETREEAERTARRLAEQRHPCELVIYDAYHRVLHRERTNARCDTEHTADRLSTQSNRERPRDLHERTTPRASS
jgi:hypothetical protein